MISFFYYGKFNCAVLFNRGEAIAFSWNSDIVLVKCIASTNTQEWKMKFHRTPSDSLNQLYLTNANQQSTINETERRKKKLPAESKVKQVYVPIEYTSNDDTFQIS